VTNPEKVRKWLSEAREQGASHMLIITDTNSNKAFTMLVMPGEDPEAIWANYPGPRKSVYLARECYKIDDDWDEQLALFRVKKF